jgi:catechol 2,3-dioxygenase-like lactoylglutathione lyase family enzyme
MQGGEIMKITGQHHVGITVSDIDRSVGFYRDVLGLELQSRGEMSGEFISKVVGVPGTHIKSAYLTVGDLTLELFQYVAPKGGRQRASLRQFDVAHYHLAFQVDDIEDAYRTLTAKGVKFSDVPQYVAEGENKGLGAIYLWDPDGVALEFIQAAK